MYFLCFMDNLMVGTTLKLARLLYTQTDTAVMQETGQWAGQYQCRTISHTGYCTISHTGYCTLVIARYPTLVIAGQLSLIL
jgi:hypothetical protein